MSTTPYQHKAVFGHFAVLDGLRGIAVLMVVFIHVSIFFPPLIVPYFQGGLLGVDIFFVLSGFLITSILLKEFDGSGRINLKNFYARRFLRLLPAYWLMLAVVYILAGPVLPSGGAEIIRSDNVFSSCLFYFSNLKRAYGLDLGVLNPTWSLSIEEQFYFIWTPFIYWLLLRLKRRSAVFVVTVAINVFLAVLLELQIERGASKDYLYNSTDCRFFTLTIGCLASMVFNWNLIPKRFLSSRLSDFTAVAVFFLAGVLASIFREPEPATYRVLPLFALSIAFIILWLVTREKSDVHPLLTARPLVWVGKVSYGLYLWHFTVIVVVSQFAWSWQLKVSAALAASLLITALSSYLLERPCLKLKERFATSRGESVDNGETEQTLVIAPSLT